MLCDDLEGWDGGRGGRLICTVIGQKPTQHCKAIFLQIKNKLKKEKKESTFPLHWVQALVGKLRSCMPHYQKINKQK